MATSARLHRPVDAASLAAFRIGFGCLLLVAALRYFTHGWIAEYFLVPTHFFKYWGFGWVRPWPGIGMYVHFGLMVLCAVGVTIGYRYRESIIGYGLLFAYAHLIDKTHYLNHYYLVICVCGLMACLPLAGMWSLDARQARLVRRVLPAWMLWALRAQFGIVYAFGGLAKLNADWLWDAQPLSIWLGRSSDMPVVGGLLSTRVAAYAMSWSGALFDLSIVPLLLLRRTRPFAYVAVVTFHLLTAQLFHLGMFPYFMICGAVLFFEPEWPRRLLARVGVGHAGQLPSASEPPTFNYQLPTANCPPPRGGARGWVGLAIGVYFAAQLMMPLRHWLYPGQMCWSEQGFRFSWNVMLMEKDGSVDFRVVEPSTGRVFRASPRDYFTPYQTAMMSPQPDMVLEAASVVAADFRGRGVVEPAVYVDAFASLNGRSSQRLVDPRVDLVREHDGLSNKTWILPMKTRQDTPVAALSRSFE